ncbi:MAG TPA: efflux RND transporter periplasmic adaptor subunit [Membranihabitans sp.]|nr:efflux RND transporter periplasmic adaptor subunit [Membranihabitans sp.]
MKIKKYSMPSGFLLLLVLPLISMLSSCQDKAEAGAAREVPVREYPVIEIQTMDVRNENKYPATIEGVENIGIRAKVDGYIQAIYVDEGEYVRKGQPLFQLETQAMNQNAAAAQSNIQVAEAGVHVAQVEVDRLKPLVAKNIISEVQLKTAEANLASAKSQVEQAKSQYQGVRENIGYTRITSPVSGYVGRIPFRQGTLVGRNESMPLTYVSNIQDVFIYFALNEKDFINFTSGLEGTSIQQKIDSMPAVEFIMANGEVYNHKGKIETITGQIDPRTGTINFRARFPNPENILRDGGSGLISIPSIYDDVLVVPLQSTYEMQGRKFVYQVNGGDTLRSQLIDYLAVVDNKVLVAEGLRPGAVILAAGVGNVRNGMIIQPRKDDFSNYIDNITPVFR